MADLNATLVQQFLNVPVTQGEAVVQPNGVLNDRHRKAVAVRLGVGHDTSAYPNPVKATQPSPAQSSAFTAADKEQKAFLTLAGNKKVTHQDRQYQRGQQRLGN